MRILRSLAAAALAVLLLAAPALAWDPIVGTGSCGGQGYSPGVYVFFFHATSDPHGATYDATAYEGNWAAGVIAQPFNATEWNAAVTTNAGPTLWARWHDDASVVTRIDAEPLCGAPSPSPTSSTIPPATGHPEVTPPPTSTDAPPADQMAFVATVLAIAATGIVALLCCTYITTRRR